MKRVCGFTISRMSRIITPHCSTAYVRRTCGVLLPTE